MSPLSRRRLLPLIGAAAVIPSIAGAAVSRGGDPFFLTARTRRGGQHGGAILSADGEVEAEFELPGRGHGGALHPGRGEAVIFARRPGRFALVLDTTSGRPLKLILARTDRHFYGHGCYSADGSRLFATENDFDRERGVIGIYDVRDGYRRIGEFDSGGIGPHELALMPDGRHLVVANGGILTHPDAPRMKLNLGEMRSSVAMIDVDDGGLIRAFTLPEELQRLSLRHLAVHGDGRIVAVAQWEGPKLEQPPLIALIDQDAGLRFVEAPGEIAARMRNYCGSVAFSGDGRQFAVSSPRGGVVTLWNGDGDFLRAIELEDGCGLAAQGDGFILTSGRGVVTSSEARQHRTHTTIAFDNHLMPLQ